MKTEKKQTTIYLPVEIYQELEKEAKKELRTTNNYIEFLLVNRRNKVKNIIKNIKTGQTSNTSEKIGLDLAHEIAASHQAKTGNKCIVQRIIDYVDQYNGRDREHFSFDVIEIINQ